MKIDMTIKLVISSIIFAASNAMAYVPLRMNNVGQSAIQGEVGLLTGTAKLKGAANSRSDSGSVFGFEYTYGLMEGMSLFGNLDYGTLTATTPQAGQPDNVVQASGLGDINLGIRGQADFSGHILWGASVAIGMGNYINDTTSTSKTALSRSTGSNWLKPYIGWETTMGSSTFGALINTEIRLSNATIENRTSTGSDTSTSVSGGEAQSLTAFYELGLDMGTLGLSFRNTGFSQNVTKPGDIKTDVTGYSILRLYGLFKMGSNVELLPFVSYQTYNSSTYDSSADYSLGAQAKWLF